MADLQAPCPLSGLAYESLQTSHRTREAAACVLQVLCDNGPTSSDVVIEAVIASAEPLDLESLVRTAVGSAGRPLPTAELTFVNGPALEACLREASERRLRREEIRQAVQLDSEALLKAIAEAMRFGVENKALFRRCTERVEELKEFACMQARRNWTGLD